MQAYTLKWTLIFVIRSLFCLKDLVTIIIIVIILFAQSITVTTSNIANKTVGRDSEATLSCSIITAGKTETIVN